MGKDVMDSKGEARICRTLDRGNSFLVAGSVRDGVKVWVGESRQLRTFDRELFSRLVKRFHGKTVEIGSSFSDPKRDSVGEWLVKECRVKGGNPAVYLTAILVDEGYAEKVKRGWVRFFDEPRPADALRNEGPADRGELRERILARIDALEDADLPVVQAALDEALGEEDQPSPFESLRGDPTFILPVRARPRYRKIVPVRISGRPLSQDVIEDRR